MSSVGIAVCIANRICSQSASTGMTSEKLEHGNLKFRMVVTSWHVVSSRRTCWGPVGLKFMLAGGMSHSSHFVSKGNDYGYRQKQWRVQAGSSKELFVFPSYLLHSLSLLSPSPNSRSDSWKVEKNCKGAKSGTPPLQPPPPGILVQSKHPSFSLDGACL